MNKYSPYILYLLISLLVVVLFVNDFGPVAGMQRSLDDFMCGFTASDDTRPNIALIRINSSAEDTYGKWPWNRDLIADLTAAVASGEPGAIVLNMELYEDAHQDSSGYTDILAEQLTWIDQAVLPYDIALATFRGDRTDNPEYLFNNSIAIENPLGEMGERSSLLARKVFLPAEKLLSSYPYLGFEYRSPDNDRILRHQPIVMNYEGYYYPSTSLITAAAYFKTPISEIKVVEGKEVRLGSIATIPINNKGEFFISFSKGSPFEMYSAAEVLAEGFNFDVLRGKVVIIGPSDDHSDQYFRTAVNDRISATIVKATVIENIINGNFLTMRNDLANLSLLVLLLFGGICAFVLPRVSLTYRMIILAGCLILLANANYLLFSSYHMVVPTLFVALQLVLFMAASPLLDWKLLTGKESEDSSKADHKPALSSRKHRSRPIEVPVREIKGSPADPNNLKTKAIGSGGHLTEKPKESGAVDYQQIDLSDDDTILGQGAAPANDSDTDSPPVHNESSHDSESGSIESIQNVLSEGTEEPENSSASIEQDDSQGILKSGSDISNLGRYQVSGILGKGAMGTVYKGVDPAINRPVALKTIRLDFVSDPEELAELKERLHREAQAAGKLSHPNIVTIYDVGSEGSLQYIAMEYLEGRTLEALIKKKVRFNYRIIAQIISQMCAALEYAHERGIVHRDIKPANIMVLNDYRIKVMDYGIARIDSTSMTKTGIAMGTPNYISPEQLKGQEIDRRADLFSLGVVMYEMLLGRRPFKGENITSLMYAIMNREPEQPSSVNPQVPLLFDHIIGKALKKNPAERYQKASDIANDLQDFVESFAR
ncbi:MAG: hypothetical protein DRP45_02440 [Candidatus Zixiibacteriota bacterium]|nr:MAG: hypothetical protein DRP45_02440 [candidate division Zixibacteria bacterium]